MLPTLLSFAALAGADSGAPQLYGRLRGGRPNPLFVPVKLRADGAVRGDVQQVGEVVILEGDDELVSSDGVGGFGISVDGRGEGPYAITKRFYTKYGDEFDEIIVFTTFDDQGTQATAYEISTQQDIDGIGEDKFNWTRAWGSNGKLHAFVNMMRWDQFDGFGVPLTDERSYMYPVLGQEFAHRWLSFLKYKDASGNISGKLLGRDEAHWASTLQAFASVMDGVQWSENADGTFTAVDDMARFSPLDLYGMGLIPATEVPDFFLLNDAVTMSGRAVNPAFPLRRNTTVRAAKETITIQQIIDANGPRVPSWDQSPHAFRVAFVLLTRPGERADEVIDIAKKLDVARTIWEKKFAEYTTLNDMPRGTMCTQVSAPCGSATAKIEGGTIVEAGGNGNGVVEPGEPIRVKIDLKNDSPVVASGIELRVSGAGLADGTKTTIDALQPSEARSVEFEGTAPLDPATCGQALTLQTESVVDGHTFRGFARTIVGLTTVLSEQFEATRGSFGVNRDGKDTALKNGWEWGAPEEYYSQRSGFVFQPSGGYKSQKAWFTGLKKGDAQTSSSALGEGVSTLLSRPFDVSWAMQPSLRYAAWFQAIDFSNPQQGGQIAPGVALVLEGTIDGGQTWVELDHVEGADPSWRLRDVPLDTLVPTGNGTPRTMMLRFTVENPGNVFVEAGVDALELRSLTRACNPNSPPTTGTMAPQATGCSVALGEPVGVRTGATSLALLFIGLGLLGTAALLRRRG
jgi:hypothetical protein